MADRVYQGKRVLQLYLQPGFGRKMSDCRGSEPWPRAQSWAHTPVSTSILFFYSVLMVRRHIERSSEDDRNGRVNRGL
jgi:hypothetical protein